MNRKAQVASTATWIIGFIAVFIIIVIMVGGAMWISGKNIVFLKSNENRAIVKESLYRGSSLIETEQLISLLNSRHNGQRMADFFSSELDDTQADIINRELGYGEHCFIQEDEKNIAGYALALIDENVYFANDVDYKQAFKSAGAGLSFVSNNFNYDKIDSAGFVVLPSENAPKYLALFRSVQAARGDENVFGC